MYEVSFKKMAYRQEQIKPYDKEGKKGVQVERMFDGIAHSYDLLNHTLSFGVDKRWRKIAIKWLKQFSPQNILDVATGTGDFAILTAKEIKPKNVLGIDLSEGMLKVAKSKIKSNHLESVIEVKKADCMKLSLADEQFDAVTVAYGVRNFENLDKGLSEMCRVMKTGGHLVIIELTTPTRFPMNMLFWIYSHLIMPFIGRLISKDSKAYSYLPATMEAFPKENVMMRILAKAGYKDIKCRRFTFGISMLYMATK